MAGVGQGWIPARLPARDDVAQVRYRELLGVLAQERDRGEVTGGELGLVPGLGELTRGWHAATTKGNDEPSLHDSQLYPAGGSGQ